MTYFSLEEASNRYEQYRPKVHGVIKHWLKNAGITKRFDTAIDIACGTGDSTIPVIDISNSVQGIDLSEVMLNKARAKGLEVNQLGYEAAHTLGQFDLITTCMAFHWFDFEQAVQAYKQASSDSSIWLIYNFSFGGSVHSKEFNDWFFDTYLTLFPTPPRNSQTANFEGVSNLEKLDSSKGTIPLSFDKAALIKYLTTQSNIEAAVHQGSSYEEVEAILQDSLQSIVFDEAFLYNYSYSIYRYTRDS
ncbi:class I SAM-dependent methyltransferase [Reinekea marina]|uniref:Class I SAM-dependent methyltransferase n=1 Tax=Reinekea marina TaxID=1310421 RepID=A0ABV7WNQ6_9GAMM|nr:class I SAM-dependent methyltransferase [Reinekea marina]MDN3649539.1 class I SAM-dependent methyltransferase [Reinekea marina]